MVHIIPVREFKNGVKFILGRVVYPKTEPENAKVKVIKPGESKVVVGKKGVYVLDDELAEKVILEAWKANIRKYKNPGARSGKDTISRPVEITEDFLRSFLKSQGVGELFIRGIISFNIEGSDVGEVLKLWHKLKDKVAEKAQA
ncbi:MAG: hypothetical protein GXO18_03965 [Aquificae bacterium]|nr:hypothetical protein [Aquificota bacterium]